MKQAIIYILILLCGIAIGCLVPLFISWEWDFQINIVEFVSALSTIILSIVVVFLTKSLDKKDVIRDYIVRDFDELCSLYQTNSDIIAKMTVEGADMIALKDEIRMVFHKGDLVIDCIKQEINESFPKFKNSNDVNLVEITTPYYKWLTDESMMKKDFRVDIDFQKMHETKLRNTISNLRIVTHKLVKSI